MGEWVLSRQWEKEDRVVVWRSVDSDKELIDWFGYYPPPEYSWVSYPSVGGPFEHLSIPDSYPDRGCIIYCHQ